MINVSTEFKELMESQTDFKQYAEITLADGAIWALDDSDFRITSNSVKDGVDANGLPLGVVAGRTIKMTFQNTDEQFKNVAFLGAEIRLYLTFQLSATVEKIELGTFTVISPEEYGETISVQAVDNAWKLDTPYTTTLQYPQTAGAVFRDICIRCSVLAESSDFLNNDFVIESAPDSGLTNREMIGYIAMIAGGNARFNRYGKLEILTYEFPDFRYADKDYDGGTFEGWTEGDILDGGDFTDWSSGDDADGGSFNPWSTEDSSGSGEIMVDKNTHVLRQWINLKPFTEDVVITGVQTTKTVTDAEGNETETPVMYGTDGYVLSVNNPLIAGKEETALALIGDVLVGARIRNFEGDHIGYPLAEFMDKVVLVDRKGNAAPTVLTDINFNFFGITTMKNSAAPPIRLSSKPNSAAARAVIAAKNMVAKEKSQRELAIKALTEALGKGGGMFSSEVEQPDGSKISYLHNKPTLEESDTILVVTSEGIGVSTDFGETYTTGLLFTGDAVLRTLQTEGINADWINTGILTGTDSKGNIKFLFDVVTGNHFVDGSSVKISLSDGETDAQTQITANASGLSSLTTKLEKDYSTTTETQSLIDQSAENIELSVTQKITDNVGNIAEEKAETAVSASLGLYVKKDENDQIVSMLNASANKINLTGNRVAITSDNFKVTYDGEIEATGGTIAGFTINGTQLYSDGGYGILLDALNGAIGVGDLSITSQGTERATVGLAGSRIVLRDDSGNYGMTLYADDGKKIRMYSDTYFNGAVEFSEIPTFPTYIPVSEGGTGKGSFTSNAVLLGNGSSAVKAASTYSGAFYSTSQGGLPSFGTLPIAQGGTGATSASAARSNLGIKGGQASVTVSSSAAKEVTVSLANASAYYIVACPNLNTSYEINWTVCSKTSTGFKIKCPAVASGFNGTLVGFDWIAIPM